MGHVFLSLSSSEVLLAVRKQEKNLRHGWEQWDCAANLHGNVHCAASGMLSVVLKSTTS